MYKIVFVFFLFLHKSQYRKNYSFQNCSLFHRDTMISRDYVCLPTCVRVVKRGRIRGGGFRFPQALLSPRSIAKIHFHSDTLLYVTKKERKKKTLKQVLSPMVFGPFSIDYPCTPRDLTFSGPYNLCVIFLVLCISSALD